MTSVDRLARCLSNRRLADHLDGFVERERALYDPNGIAVAWLRESAKRLRECTCPRIIPAGGAAPLDAAGRRVDRGSGSPPVPDPDRHPNGEAP